MVRLRSLLITFAILFLPAIAHAQGITIRSNDQVIGDSAQCKTFTPASGSPEGSVTAKKCDEYIDISTGNHYYKTTGTSASPSNTGWLVVSTGTSGSIVHSIGITIDGGGSTPSTGIKGDFFVPYNATINSVTLLADQSGSIVIDIWKDTYANYPPTNADSITASAKPTLSSATKSQDTTLTGWTTTLSAGDTLRFNVDSVSTITRVTLVLKITLN